jgi:hypothetical protein
MDMAETGKTKTVYIPKLMLPVIKELAKAECRNFSPMCVELMRRGIEATKQASQAQAQ